MAAAAQDDSGATSTAPVRKFPKHLVEIYDIDCMLGTGASSTVYRCVHRSTGEVRAIKKIDTSEVPAREIAHEVALMRLLRHECVVRCYEVFLEAQYVNIVVDIFTGGDLVDGLNAHRKDRGRLPDGQLAHLAKQMVEAVQHVHSLRIVHRDIKGENFLSDRPDIGDPACRVALADFGTAKRLEADAKLEDRVGTPAFWAPEVWAGSYDCGVDVWAVGVTAFILLSSQLPFSGEEDICRATAPGEMPVDMPYYASKGCTDFIGQCLVKDASGRPSAAGVAKHEWLKTPPGSGGVGGSFSMKAPTGQQVAAGAGVVGDVLVDGLGAVIMGCLSGVGLCLDILLGGGEVAKKPQPSEGATVPTEPQLQGAPAGAAQRPARLDVAGPDPQAVDIEKEITELTKQISSTQAPRPR
mmetsp:Transcript_69198/g.198487  ORF Transcript_69198/g.198487 Transcript_69198/m.198487 type:complete len:411 (-) Transcript_69198:150-1382(-)